MTERGAILSAPTPAGLLHGLQDASAAPPAAAGARGPIGPAAASAMGHPRRGDRGRAPLPLSRPPPGRGALVLPAGVHREGHRPPRALQAQHPPPAPDRRPGWRLEIKKYPRLTQVGAWRKETIVGQNFDPYVGDGTPHGGFYTQEQMRDLVAYAAARARHDHARDRDAGPRAGRPRGLPGAVVHRRAVRGVDQVGRARRHLLPERADLRVPGGRARWR